MVYTSKAKKHFSGDGVTMEIDLEQVIDFLSAGNALTIDLGDKKSRYLDTVADEAFKKADDDFNVQAIAAGKAGTIPHMFEWGTLGINKGRSSTRPAPTSPNARLWETYTEGTGLDRFIWYAFKPSVGVVPKPTTGETGISQEVISKMRDHKFVWKARIIEEGTTVTIKRDKAKFLLFPVRDKSAPYLRPNDKKRGYTLRTKAYSSTPGGTEKKPGKSGNFTNLFTVFWVHSAKVNEYINESIISDYQPELLTPRRTNLTVRPVGSFDIKAETKRRAKQVQARALTRARNRRAQA